MFGGFILEVWTHGRVTMDPLLFTWLLSTAVTGVLWFGALTMLRATNQHLRVAFLYVLSSAAAVGLAGLLMAWTGNLANAGLALLLTDAVMALCTMKAAARLLNVNLTEIIVTATNPTPLLVFLSKKVGFR